MRSIELNCRGWLVVALLVVALLCAAGAPFAPHTPAADPLPSWNEGATKQAILKFVANVTTEGSPNFVAPGDRLATFDNDGTLWCEQPVYVQFAFVIDRIKATAADHPEWKEKAPFKFVLNGDVTALIAGGEKGIFELVAATHSGMTTDEFEAAVRDWLKTAQHPRFKRRYTELVYQPMLELLAYLRAKGFKTFIVTGGGVDFVRVFSQSAYGIPPEQVVGSTGKLKYEVREGRPVLIKLPQIDLIDDGAGKPVGIETRIGRMPIFAFGNSDGDFEMLEYVTMQKKAAFGGIVHHTDAQREFAYDRKSRVGRLDRALDAAAARGWKVTDMRRDWKVIFPSENPQTENPPSENPKTEKQPTKKQQTDGGDNSQRNDKSKSEESPKKKKAKRSLNL